MKPFRSVALLTPLAILLLATAATARPLGHETQALLDALLAPTHDQARDRIQRQAADPAGRTLRPSVHGAARRYCLMNDDGKATDDHGSRLLAISPGGKISVLMGPDKLLLVTGFDLAPPGFGAWGGKLFSLSQATTAMKGALTNHVIQRIDLANHTAEVVCTLPTAGTVGKGIPAAGADARFGPAGSGFANIFYSATLLNSMIYQTLPDGSCKPFVDLSSRGGPAGLAFTPDGSAMLVTVSPIAATASNQGANGMIVRVTPDGKVDPTPVVKGLRFPFGLAIAPAGFGAFGGQIFVTDMGDFQAPVPQTQALKRDGKVYRVTKEGELKLVASGFVNPAGLRFIGNHLWVTDINGDFVGGMRELPDGFLVQIDVK
jgi:hypothetical protein